MADGASASGLRDERNVCQLCGALENLSLCGGCREIWYCCKDHQRAHWKEHKRKCKQKQHKTDVCRTEQVTTGTSYTSLGTPTLPSGVLSDSRDFAAAGVSSSQETVLLVGEEYAASVSAGENENFNEEKQHVSDCGKLSEVALGTQEKSAKHTDEINKKDRLPTITEEGERYFLDVPFAKTVKSKRHTNRLRQSADAMSPKGTTVDTKLTYLDILKSRFSVIAEYVVKCLQTYGICVIDGFLGEATGTEIFKEVKQLQDLGVFRKGQLVHTASASSDAIRGDIITWVDGRGQSSENIQFLVSCMDAVVKNCSCLMEGYTINERTKAMVACYPRNSTGYVRHIDNPNGDGRCITCIYYLNQNWNGRQDGGLLRIFPEGKDRVANVEPNFDRLLFFWSDRRNPHEVLPSTRDRYAITVWYYEAEERARALKQYRGEVSSHPKKEAVPLFNVSQNEERDS